MSQASHQDGLRALGDEDSRFAPIGGLDVHYQVSGDAGADHQVLLLHHFYGNVWTWRHVLDALGGDSVRVAAFDRAGFGLTQRPRRGDWNGTNPYTRAAAADLTVGLLDTLGIDRAVLVGSSAGGTVALETYARHPDRVRALVLVGAAITGDVGPPGFLRPLLRTSHARRAGRRLVRRLGRDIDAARVGGSWYDPSRVTDADIDAYARPLRAPDWDMGLWELISAEAPPHLVEVLRGIDVPTLVVTGDADPVVRPDLSRRTAAAIPGARLVTLPQCGHTPQEECPQALAAAIRDLLAEL